MHGRALGEAADELVEKLLGADLKVERVGAVLDADVEELCIGERRLSWAGMAGQLLRTLSASRATFWLRWLT